MKTNPKFKTEPPTRLRGGLIGLLVLLLVAYFTLAPYFPNRVKRTSAPANEFSGERAMAHLAVIAREPHPQGSPAQARVRDYLIQELTGYGIEVEVQRTTGLENVVARLHGSDPSGAIVILAHYDLSTYSPGAADNGSGVAALLEIMRALSADPAPHNDIIALFDDGEELPGVYAGTKAFVREHPWMADVRVAIGMDTAVRGYICTDDTGLENGWMVRALSHAYTGGAWHSISGGGGYDSKPFRDAGIQILELEDNYPFFEQHTPGDVPAIVKPGTLQQLGEQVLAVSRELGNLDLGVTKGRQETYASIPPLIFLHYPESLAVFFAILAGITLITAFVLCMVRKLTSWRGLAVALLTTLIVSVLSAVGVNALWKAAPQWFGWQTNRWSEWPEVIPPHGWLLMILSNLVILGLMAVVYRLARRWSSRTDFSMMVLLIFLPITFACAIAIPRASIVPVWPVLVGSAGWAMAAILFREHRNWTRDMGALLAAISFVIFILPLIPGVFMGDGTKSVAIISGVWPLILSVLLPAVDALLVYRPMHSK